MPLAPSACEDLAYSKQFFTITRRGHTLPTAEFGSPTLVWHVAFWPRRDFSPDDIQVTRSEGEAIIRISADEIRASYNRRVREVITDFNLFLRKLRHRAAVQDNGNEDIFEPRRPLDWSRQSDGEPFDDFGTDVSGFTLWWTDEAPSQGNMLGDALPRTPPLSALRVRVQVEVHADMACVSFFIDAGKPWNRPPIYRIEPEAGNDVGERRKAIFRHVANIKRICEGRIAAPLIDAAILPEPDEDFSESARELKAAADYLYDQVWQEFCRDFDFNLCDIAGRTDEIFANFRGLVISTRGRDPEPQNHSVVATPGRAPFARFDGHGEGYGVDATEPNAVVKSFMPFMRRVRSDADWRDWIASGIFNWRAIYITALGAQSEFRDRDEGELHTFVPAGHLPTRLIKEGMAVECREECGEFGKGREAPQTPQNDRPAPFRYLLLTKFEPNRRQVGRMVERINTLGTRRLYALKDWTVIQQAGMWIRVYGLQLDEAYKHWIAKLKGIDQAHHDRLWGPIAEIAARTSDEALQAEILRLVEGDPSDPEIICRKLKELSAPRQDGDWPAIRSYVDELLKDDGASIREKTGQRDKELADANRGAEKALIAITAALDELGAGTPGGLPYRIARSRYYADLFRDGTRTLRIGNIETWWSYDQFAHRGMEPALRSIASVGERLERLRARLQATKQDIQTSAIVNQTEATRDNTYKLERIQAELARLAKATEGYTTEIKKSQLRAAEETERANKKIHELMTEIMEQEKKLNDLKLRAQWIRFMTTIIVTAIGGFIILALRILKFI